MSIETFTELASRIAWATDADQLHAVARLVWVQHGQGRLTDGEAEDLHGQVAAYRSAPKGLSQSLGAAVVSAVGAAKRARRVKPADQRERTRAMAYGGWLPRPLASRYTNGELAVLSVYAREVARRGFCDLHVGTIAYRAGVSERTVRNARHLAEQDGLLTCHHRGTSKNRLGSIVRIVSAEWLAWLAKREPRKGGKTVPPCHTSVQGKRLSGRPGRRVPASVGAAERPPQRKSPGG